MTVNDRLVNRHHKVIRELRQIVKHYDDNRISDPRLIKAIYLLQTVASQPANTPKNVRNETLRKAIELLVEIQDDGVIPESVRDLVYQLPTQPGLPGNPDGDKLTSIRYLMDNYRLKHGFLYGPISDESLRLLQAIEAVLKVGENQEPLPETVGDADGEYDEEDDESPYVENEEDDDTPELQPGEHTINLEIMPLEAEKHAKYYVITEGMKGEILGITENIPAEADPTKGGPPW